MPGRAGYRRGAGGAAGARALLAMASGAGLLLGGALGAGSACADLAGAAGELAPEGMTYQLKIGFAMALKGKWNKITESQCRASLVWMDNLRSAGGIRPTEGGLLGVKFFTVDISKETESGNGVLDVGGSKATTYEGLKALIDAHNLDAVVSPYSSSLTPYAAKAGLEAGIPVLPNGASESVYVCPECSSLADCEAAAFNCKKANTRRFDSLVGSISPGGQYFRDFVSSVALKGAQRIAVVGEERSFTLSQKAGALAQARASNMDIVADIVLAESGEAALHTTSEDLLAKHREYLESGSDNTFSATVSGSSWESAAAVAVELLERLDVDVVIGYTYVDSCIGLVKGMKTRNWLPKALGLGACLGNSAMFSALGKDMRWLAGPSQWDHRLKGRDFEETQFTSPNHFAISERRPNSPQQFYDKYVELFSEPPIYQATMVASSIYMLEGAASTTGAVPRPADLTDAMKSYYSPSWWGLSTADAFGKNERRSMPTWYYDEQGSLEIAGPISAATVEIKYPLPSWDSNERNFPCPPGSMVEGKNEWSSNLGEFMSTGKATWDSTSCKICPAGHFSDIVGSTVCNPCPAGTFAPSQGSPQCLPCPSDTTCRGGTDVVFIEKMDTSLIAVIALASVVGIFLLLFVIDYSWKNYLSVRAKSPVFISYKHADTEKASKIAAKLRASGLQVWIDSEIRANEDWRKEIADAINSSLCILFVASELSVASKYCREELLYASSRGKPVITANTEDCLSKLEGALKMVLLRKQAIDMRGDKFEEGLQTLAETLRDVKRDDPGVIGRLAWWRQKSGNRPTRARGRQVGKQSKAVDIFCICTPEDSERAKTLMERCATVGLETSFSSHHEEDAYNVNASSIDQAALVVFLESEDSLTRQETQDELFFAYEEKKKLVRVQLENTSKALHLNSSMSLMLNRIKIVIWDSATGRHGAVEGQVGTSEVALRQVSREVVHQMWFHVTCKEISSAAASHRRGSQPILRLGSTAGLETLLTRAASFNPAHFKKKKISLAGVQLGEVGEARV